MPVPDRPKIYHILRLDRLAAVAADGFLWSDAEMMRRNDSLRLAELPPVATRRLKDLTLACHRDLHIGECAAFHFCPRSVRLYLIYRQSAGAPCHDGQDTFVHLEADLHAAIAWADARRRRWAFTLSNAGTCYFEDRADIDQLGDINWHAVQARGWGGDDVPKTIREGKQAEFLIEQSFPWHLFERIGVFSQDCAAQASACLPPAGHRPAIETRRDWYY